MRNSYYDKHAYRKLLLSIEKIELKNKKVKYACNNTALLIVDAQAKFCMPETLEYYGHGNAETKGKSKIIQKLAPQFRQATIPIYAIHFSEKKEEPNFYIFQPEKKDITFRKTCKSVFAEATADLADDLRIKGIKHVLVCGFNRSACVRATAEDAAKLGFNTFLLDDISADNNMIFDTPKSFVSEKMRAAGVNIITARNFLKHLTAPR